MVRTHQAQEMTCWPYLRTNVNTGRSLLSEMTFTAMTTGRCCYICQTAGGPPDKHRYICQPADGPPDKHRYSCSWRHLCTAAWFLCLDQISVCLLQMYTDLIVFPGDILLFLKELPWVYDQCSSFDKCGPNLALHHAANWCPCRSPKYLPSCNLLWNIAAIKHNSKSASSLFHR